MIKVGTNTYVTVDEADQYISFSVDFLNWEVLSTSEKERALVTATRKIDSLMLVGVKGNANQPLAFPRAGQSVVPQEVKNSEIEEALALSNIEVLQRQSLISQGVKAVSIGNVSESYSENIKSSQYELLSAEANLLMRPYLLLSAKVV